MIIVTRRSASAPLPPILLVPRKIGGALRPQTFCSMSVVNNPFPTPPPARAGRPRPSRLGARAGPSDSSLPPPAPGGGLITMLTRSRQYPNPHPRPPLASLAAPLPLPAGGFNYHANSLRQYPNPHPRPLLASLAAPLPLPVGGFNYIGYTINNGNTQPRPHPPPARAGRPRPSRLGARAGPSDSSLPPAPPAGGFDYIYYTMETIIACPPPITPPHRNRLFCSPLATICRRLHRLRLLQMHARGERCLAHAILQY